jgi:hypothetical protein
MIPLRFYANPPSEEKFAGFESFELRLDKVSRVGSLGLYQIN